MPRFILRSENHPLTEFDAGGNDIFIGRVASINDIGLNDPSVSKKHAHIKRREEGFTIYDLKSLNGVILNGTRVSRALLKDGDQIRLGDVTLEFRNETDEITEAKKEIVRKKK